MDIANLAERFCMIEAEDWAQKQLQEITSSLRPGFENWLEPADILSALSYFKLHDTGSESNINLIRKARMVACFVIVKRWEHNPAELYNAAKLDRVLSGILFARILLFGHRSPVWAQFTQSERATLYAAQVHLTPLPTSPSFRYLGTAEAAIAAMKERDSDFRICASTIDTFKGVWEGNNRDAYWKSSLPLRGIQG
ncbi:hypothetical protein FRC07_000093, partial [Ceratobasidium sp. 392]